MIVDFEKAHDRFLEIIFGEFCKEDFALMVSSSCSNYFPYCKPHAYVCVR